MTMSSTAGGNDTNGLLSTRLWDSAQPIYDEILRHPFITSLIDGTLPREAFTNYLAQDEHYIKVYASCLCLVASRAPDMRTMGTLASQAAVLGLDESGLHKTLLDQMGADPDAFERIEAAPTTVAYSGWILATCERETLLRSLVSLLPCYWIYGEVGRHLLAGGSPDAVYAGWIDGYGGDAYQKSLGDYLAIVDRLGADVDEDELAACVALYRRGAQFEWCFWDAALKIERWPVS